MSTLGRIARRSLLAQLQAGARLVVVAFCALTTLYAVVASSTFAYLQFLRPRVFPWTGTFGDGHALLGWAWLALLIFVLAHDLRRPWHGRRWSWALVLVSAAAVVWNTKSPVLPMLGAEAGSPESAAVSVGARSHWVAVAALVPVLWLSAIDVLRCGRARLSPDAPLDLERIDGRLLMASARTALTVTALFAAVAGLRVLAAFEPDLPPRRLILLAARSATYHVLVFTALFLAAAVSLRAGTRMGGRWRWAIWFGALVVAVGSIFDGTVGLALTLRGVFRYAMALLAGTAVLGTWIGWRLARPADEPSASGDPIELLFGRSSGARPAKPIVAVAGLALLAWAVPVVSAAADWDDVVLRLGTTAVWIVTFGWTYRRLAPGRPVTNRTVMMACVAPLGALAVLPSLPAPNASPSPGLTSSSTLVRSGDADALRRALARYAVYDPSFRLARGLASPDTNAGAAFDRFLRANTDLTGMTVTPTPLDFVPNLGQASHRPAVFLFVVDSLRHDYLAPYNPKVWFTPSIAAFAADSLVFSNAFTRYGGTGLSVPAIWAGSALPHKQYVTPFHSMNTLEKLLDVNGYRRFVSLDSIMGLLLRPSPLLDELDRGVTVMDYELCRTLSELEMKLAHTPHDVPVFAYTLPQDVHMSRLSRWTMPVGDFSGFHAPYAGRVQAIDACFGRFIETLRRLGLYDRSVVVLTSDHGELFGENGQFGHSYHMRPEVVRVPLIMHLPLSATASAQVDSGAVALTTDITPTIYAALGYQPVASSPLMGRSLVDDTDEQRTRRRRDVFVLAASYGAVYAVVSRNGRRLYVADAVKGDDHLWERVSNADAWTERPLSADTRAVERYRIRRHIDRTAEVFALPALRGRRTRLPKESRAGRRHGDPLGGVVRGCREIEGAGARDRGASGSQRADEQ
ncbi:MAG: hypothetical protein FJW27_10465 [Acidimicrobiia bacterium]|nr:hypothetical protein [Acidimicrobiia bacterium]